MAKWNGQELNGKKIKVQKNDKGAKRFRKGHAKSTKKMGNGKWQMPYFCVQINGRTNNKNSQLE
jgi:hypothetical protein